nr:hypothetical protein [Streptococcus pneumoniae]
MASSGKMLRNTYTPDSYYVGNLGAWQYDLYSSKISSNHVSFIRNLKTVL